MVNTIIPKNYTTSPSSLSGTPYLTINHEATIDLDSSSSFEGALLRFRTTFVANSTVGPEKLLEVWFCASPSALPAATAPNGLRIVPAQVWKDMLDLVNCKVLSVVESEHIDAYLLSESSMFVFPHKLILKTCGTTTLLSGLPKILEIAALVASFPHAVPEPTSGIATAATPYRVFYSRKNFLFPDRQRGPHRSWRDEVRSLDKLFLGGSAYMIGKMNGEHWYLYLTEPNTVLTPPATPDRVETKTKVLDLPNSQRVLEAHDRVDEPQDETLEILMTDLDEIKARQFYLDDASAVAEGHYFQSTRKARKDAQEHLGNIGETGFSTFHLHDSGYSSKSDYSYEGAVDVFSNTSSDTDDLLVDEKLTFPQELATEGHALGTVVSETCGLADVYPTAKYPDARIDAYLFTPCGFSANGVIPASEGPNATHYFTVHVTPEPHCSYASFETNVPSQQTGRETAEVVEHVVSIFKPGRFSVTIFEAKVNINGDVDAAMLAELRIKNKLSMRMESIRGYRRVDRIVHDLEGYELVFRYYERLDWEGGAPRLGEVGF